MEFREATREEAEEIARREHQLFGTSINPCQSIPPRHNPYTLSDGTTRCTICGQEIESE